MFPATVELEGGATERWDGTDAVRPVPTVTLTPDPRGPVDDASAGSGPHDHAAQDPAANEPGVAPPPVSAVIDGATIAAVTIVGLGVAAGWGILAVRRSRRRTRRPAS